MLRNKYPFDPSKWLPYLIALLLWIALSCYSSDYLRQIEGRSIFLFDWFWIKDFIYTPGGIISCISLFFTQFMHLPWLGSFIWVVLLTLSAKLTAQLYNINTNRSLIAWIPAFILVGSNMALGYLIYVMNRQGYLFEPTLGYLLILATVTITRRIQKFIPFILTIIAWSIIGYWIGGYWAFASIVAAISYHICFANSTSYFKITAVGVTAVAVIVIAPHIFWGMTTFNLSQGRLIGLPTALYKEPLVPIRIAIIVVTLIPTILHWIKKAVQSAPQHPLLFQLPLFAICSGCLFLVWFKDANFNAEMSMIEATHNLDWNKSVSVMRKVNERAENKKDYQPTRVMVTLKDLALIKLGQESQSAFAFDDGSQQQKRGYGIPMEYEIGPIMYLHYGIPGFCYRWCLEETGEFGWSHAGLQYMVMSSISMNDQSLTPKYLDMLDHTLFYRKWSQKQRDLFHDRSKTVKTAPYDRIIPLMCYEDELKDDQRGIETTLSRHFLGPTPIQSTSLYDKVALFWAMKSQDPLIFWIKLLTYIESSGIEKLDRYYQEAAYLYSHISHDDTLMELPYDKITEELYKAFVSTAQKHEFDINSLDDARRVIPARLRQTYYYYFSFIRGLELF